MKEVFITTKNKGLELVLNPENGKWIVTNKYNKYKEMLLGNINFQPLKGTNLILFNVGRKCNLRCIYCFLKNKRDENKEMSFDTAKIALKRVSEMKEGVKRIVFHGSEPLLEFDLIKRIIILGKMLDRNITYSIQTNGTLLSNDIIKFFVENNVYIGISLDGTKNVQNKTRPFVNGKGSFYSVINNLLEVRKQQGKASFITVVTKYNVNQLGKIVNLAKKMDIQNISFNPVLTEDYSIIPNENELTESMIKVTEQYFFDLKNNIKTPRLDHPQRYLSAIMHTEKQTNSCILCGAGPSNPLIAIDVDGYIYPCDHFWGEQNFVIGHINNMSLDNASKSLKNFRNNMEFNNLENCFSCNWKRICSGGCPGGRIMSNKAQYCNTTNKIITYLLERIPWLKENNLLTKIFY